MRYIKTAEQNQRGCVSCADFVRTGVNRRKKCRFDECPYHELDDCENFVKYAKIAGRIAHT